MYEAPADVVEFPAKQLSAAPELLKDYGSRPQTRTDHLSKIERNLTIGKLDFTA